MAVVKQKPVFPISGERFPQLLQSPLRRRMFGRIEMNQPSRTDLQRHKHIAVEIKPITAATVDRLKSMGHAFLQAGIRCSPRCQFGANLTGADFKSK